MDNIKTYQQAASQSDRWDAVDNYLVCVSECDLNDGTCVTHCVETHLRPETEDQEAEG